MNVTERCFLHVTCTVSSAEGTVTATKRLSELYNLAPHDIRWVFSCTYDFYGSKPKAKDKEWTASIKIAIDTPDEINTSRFAPS